MIQAFFSFFFFLLLLIGIGMGASWLVDNQTVFVKSNKESIQKLSEKEKSTLGELDTNKQETEKTKEDTPPKKEVTQDKASLDIIVLNGGAQTGMAKTIAQKLVSQGFSQAKASNASSYTYKGLTIYFQGDDRSLAEEIAQSISESAYKQNTIEKAQTADHTRARITIIAGE